MDEGNDDGLSDIQVLIGVTVMFGLLIGGLVGYGEFMEWQEEGWGQHACEEKYGDYSEYVGETSAFGGSGICDVNGEQKYVEVEYGGLIPPGDSND